MPAVSDAQMRYAGLIRSGGKKASPKTQEWANELLNKSAGLSMDSLPEHVEGPNYAALSKARMRKGGIARYGK